MNQPEWKVDEKTGWVEHGQCSIYSLVFNFLQSKKNNSCIFKGLLGLLSVGFPEHEDRVLEPLKTALAAQVDRSLGVVLVALFQHSFNNVFVWAFIKMPIPSLTWNSPRHHHTPAVVVVQVFDESGFILLREVFPDLE